MNPLPLLATFAALAVIGTITVEALERRGRTRFTNGLADASGLCGASALIGLLVWAIVGLVS